MIPILALSITYIQLVAALMNGYRDVNIMVSSGWTKEGGYISILGGQCMIERGFLTTTQKDWGGGPVCERSVHGYNDQSGEYKPLPRSNHEYVVMSQSVHHFLFFPLYTTRLEVRVMDLHLQLGDASDWKYQILPNTPLDNVSLSSFSLYGDAPIPRESFYQSLGISISRKLLPVPFVG
jgi:hypothetical protein